MEKYNTLYGKCKYNLDLICQCQEYTLNSDEKDECLLCKHNRGWHEKLYTSSYLAGPKMSTSTNYKVLKNHNIIISLNR